MTSNQLDGETFDLSDIFIGRDQQLDLFEIYFHRWKELSKKADTNPTFITVPSPNHKIQGLVVLLYGRGGFGKSTLLKGYRTFVLQENDSPLTSKVFISAIIDWEAVPQSRRSLFNLSPDKEINAQGYFRMLSAQLAGA